MNEKMTVEQAENEFRTWCDANEFECDVDSMTEDMKVAFNSTKKDVIKAMRAGRLILDGTGMQYTVSKFSPEGFAGVAVTISRPTGNIWLAMDGKKDVDRMHKMQAAMSALTGKDTGWFSRLDVKDWSFFQGIASLFLIF